MTVQRWAVSSSLTGCPVKSRPRDRFSRYPKWPDTFRTGLVMFYFQPLHNIQFLRCYMFRPPLVAIIRELQYYKDIRSLSFNLSENGKHCCMILNCDRCWRHTASNRKFVDSIPDGVILIFHCFNPSSRTMALGSTQPLTEMSTRNIPWGVKAAGTWG